LFVLLFEEQQIIPFMKIRNLLLLLLALSFNNLSFGQINGLPRASTPEELQNIEQFRTFYNNYNFSGITDPPSSPVRTMGEWEELQAVVITWTSYKPLLADIVDAIQDDVNVLIVCSSQSTAEAQLQNYGVTPNPNVKYIEVGSGGFNSIWMRDYGANPAYLNDVDSLILVDWIYNRNRPDDDVLPEEIADFLGVPLYETIECPDDLVNTGGNYMSDGMGTAFSSKLVLDENLFSPFVICPKNEQKVDEIMQNFMGIDRYIKFDKLPFDGIHHIDMHMKLLDEETILVGEFPQNTSDGPQIEANMQYLLSNFKTSFGNDYKLVRIPMPSCSNGQWPDDCQGAEYRTYANALFVNKTVLVPTYGIPLDNTALDIWEQALPGYNIVGLNSSDIIFAGGAIHCITKEVGVNDPLWIAHSKLNEVCADEDVRVQAIIKHRSGVSSAEVMYTTDLSAGFESLAMTVVNDSLWEADLPEFPETTEVYYYIHAEANSGKEINRPIVAPEGYWTYAVGEPCAVNTLTPVEVNMEMAPIYPNPASDITVVPISCDKSLEASIRVTDILGRDVETLFNGILPKGDSKYFIHADDYQAGTYFVTLQTAQQQIVQKLIVK
jgi:agmatine deiminase